MLAYLQGLLEDSDDDSKLTANLKRVILEQMEGSYGDDTTQRMILYIKQHCLTPGTEGTM